MDFVSFIGSYLRIRAVCTASLGECDSATNESSCSSARDETEHTVQVPYGLVSKLVSSEKKQKKKESCRG